MCLEVVYHGPLSNGEMLFLISVEMIWREFSRVSIGHTKKGGTKIPSWSRWVFVIFEGSGYVWISKTLFPERGVCHLVVLAPLQLTSDVDFAVLVRTKDIVVG